MNQKRPARQATALFVIATFALVLFATGCGSGGGTQNANLPPLSDVTATTNPITRATENAVSDDAKTLAVRQASGEFVSLDAARAFDADLAAIRAAYPDVQTLHPKPTYDAKKLFVSLDLNAPFREKWFIAARNQKQYNATDLDLTTGNPALDALLKKYDVTEIEAFSRDFGGDYYILTLGASINVPIVAEALSASSSFIKRVESVGPGVPFSRANLEFALGDGGNSHVYTYSQYYDDRSGDNKLYLRTYTLSRGGVSEKISGTPPSQ